MYPSKIAVQGDGGTIHLEKFLVDERHEFSSVGEETLNGSQPVLHLILPPGTICSFASMLRTRRIKIHRALSLAAFHLPTAGREHPFPMGAKKLRFL